MKKTSMSSTALSIDESWRIFRIMAEFVDAIETLSRVKNAVSIFGSARTKPDDPYYQKAELLSRLLAERGFGVITGGGPGIMEAANKGAAEAGGQSVGMNIRLPLRAEAEPLREYQHRLQVFFHPEGDVRQVCHGLCRPARRLRDAG